MSDKKSLSRRQWLGRVSIAAGAGMIGIGFSCPSNNPNNANNPNNTKPFIRNITFNNIQQL